MSSTHLATAFVAPFDTLRMTDVEAVGGKNASLGEMISQLSESGVRVPGGFATTAHAFRAFLAQDGLAARISARLAKLDAAEDETVDIDFSDRLIEHGATWRDVFRGPRDGDGEFDARTEVERFMRDHFATDELEIA
jgi:pyruvate,water dikinase